jgi:hypothetical protein
MPRQEDGISLSDTGSSSFAALDAEVSRIDVWVEVRTKV